MAYFETKDQAIKTTETLNRSKQYLTKQYKINDKNGPREQKQQSKILSKPSKRRWYEKNTKGEKTEGLSCMYGQKKVGNVVQIMGKKCLGFDSSDMKDMKTMMKK